MYDVLSRAKKKGKRKEGIGRLSLLTAEVVAAAAKSEIQTGRRVRLGWDMTQLEYSQFGRQNLLSRCLLIESATKIELLAGAYFWITTAGQPPSSHHFLTLHSQPTSFL
ncbi:unnamed protein product [Diplocarpon coronariae]